jgi:phosphonopyruvate decarboxylase
MGSVLPICVGLSIAKPDHKIIAIEGDGSVLMNLGGLVTLKRYGRNNILLFIMDNGQYESTGGQISQPDDFYLEKVCAATGLETSVGTEYAQLTAFLKNASQNQNAPQVMILKVMSEPPAERIYEAPVEIAGRFYNWINK